LDKVGICKNDCRLKSTERTGHGSPKDIEDASQVFFPSVRQ